MIAIMKIMYLKINVYTFIISITIEQPLIFTKKKRILTFQSSFLALKTFLFFKMFKISLPSLLDSESLLQEVIFLF
jgi:hypothetical protein